MMVWSKSQTDDVGDVLLKLNLLIRKISDYEIRFGSQYEGFREKIKYLRTKDDSLCEMGRRQSDLQARILDASKSKLRSAKARLLQSELDDIQKDSAPAETELQRLKRQLIKDAYTEQLNAIIELGRKMQIIGDHGKQLLEHIDLPGTPSDGKFVAGSC
ncbi:MAG: Eisosome component PIL1/LSP1 [Podila humilis]|nr:MAG: Eisosome component PIL1/LSP1 [Podila humilis]